MTSQEHKQKRKRRMILCFGILVLLLLLCAVVLVSRSIMDAKKPGWHDAGKADASYVEEDGSKATGYQMIDGKPFFFREDGTPAAAGWIDEKRSDGTNRYYCVGNGELATGWKYLDKKAIYFYQEEDAGEGRVVGAQASDYTTSGQIEIPSEGYLDGDEGLALAYGMDVLNRYGWELDEAYKYASSLRFIAGSDEHYGLTIHTCALQGFEHGEGNCLVWAGTFCVMAKLLGYDCREIWGTLEWKGTRPHAWTEIWEEDGPHVYDPRKHDGEDMAGFDVHYGDKGSYRYNEDSKQYLDW